MTLTEETAAEVWLKSMPIGSAVPLIAYSPTHKIGVTPRGPRTPGVHWWRVASDGTPIEAATEPNERLVPVDLILFRLSQAYSALMLAGNDATPPAWKA